jgi:FtsZ-binding cell division protein ZapB|tara:strand:- start:3 stop:281 length:279 start_codon:yes stop_codon:yes gene_type:complete
MELDKLQHLENLIDRLIRSIQFLRNENDDLKNKNESFEKEAERLKEEHSSSQAKLDKTAKLEKKLKHAKEANSKAKLEVNNILKTIENFNFN